MPPRLLARPAADGRALRRRAGVLRRPAAAAEVEEGFEEERRRPALDSEAVVGFEEGGEVAARDIALGVWEPGLQVLCRGVYWGREIRLAVNIEGIQFVRGALELNGRMSGTEDEALLRWGSKEEVKNKVRLHVCPSSCSNVPEADGLVHLKHVQRRGHHDPAWADNMRSSGGLEELKRLADKSAKEARGDKKRAHDGEEYTPTNPPEKDGKGSSSSSDEKKKKKKKRKKRKPFRVIGKKDYNQLFQSTGLDRDVKVRKKVAKLARKAMRKRSKDSSEDSSSSSTKEEDGEDMETLFQESQKTQLAAKAGPGSLTAHAVRQMRRQMLTTMGQELEENSPIQPVALQFYRQILKEKLTPIMSREVMNLCTVIDALLEGKVAFATDVAIQRVKALEAISNGASWAVAQRYELCPPDLGQIASTSEAAAAAKETKEEVRARALQRGVWETPWRGQKGEGEKGKSKKGQEKGKGKGSKSDRDRQKGEKTDK